ncbi:hypothetical protein KWT13_19230 [Clostridioides difficile]|uniref:hypothetical protein n=1 Tax=Clostridioides difficile TaxID=1496 RepID=UPI0008A157BF|nr:hypothetical protein [Clostridioides difficile]OFU33351.1 hypothetical protein HMPREF3075_05510 [Clostridium sp. HMSC19B11]EGT4052812.1 hypothetical protein [Clostridioides difficile]EGT5448943.1 hypothetical protein [Clostridioides difficile]MBF4710573.1 hypothetical protein [Clostridioides difficile]MBY1443958.1 hypothetical protein [Clostridioides difficile]
MGLVKNTTGAGLTEAKPGLNQVFKLNKMLDQVYVLKKKQEVRFLECNMKKGLYGLTFMATSDSNSSSIDLVIKDWKTSAEVERLSINIDKEFTLQKLNFSVPADGHYNLYFQSNDLMEQTVEFLNASITVDESYIDFMSVYF